MKGLREKGPNQRFVKKVSRRLEHCRHAYGEVQGDARLHPLDRKRLLTYYRNRARRLYSALKPPPVPRERRGGFSIGQAARLLGVCTKTLLRWEAKGLIRCGRSRGRHRRVSREEVLRILELRRAGKVKV